MRSISTPMIAVGWMIALAHPTLASDGVLEISQTCAVETGCFAGDSPGLPVTISVSGSHRLTSNLSAGADVDGIVINTARASIDFNGFSLTGGTIGSGVGNGISGGGVDGSFAGFATIKNGTIRGARALGVALGGARGVRIENMTIEFNAGGGVELGEEARVRGSGFANNGSTSPNGDGLVAGDGSAIVGNTVSGSGGRGIVAGGGSTILENASYQNGGTGIEAVGAPSTGLGFDGGSVVAKNAVYENGGIGITAGDAARIIDNSVYSNGGIGIAATNGTTVSGNSVFGSGGDGIQAGFGSTISHNSSNQNEGSGLVAFDGSNVSDNTARGNGTDGSGYGISLGSSDSAFRNNVVSSPVAPGRGTINGTGVDAGGNVCNGSLTCP